MSSFAPFHPSFHLRKVETATASPQTEVLFFDQRLAFIPKGTQLLLGVFIDPSGEGHLDALEGVSVQLDTDSGTVLDTLQKGQPAGKLDSALSERTDVRLSIHIEQHGRVFLPHLTVSDGLGFIGGVDLDVPWPDREDETLILPAFYTEPDVQLSAFCGYYSENLFRPEFGDTQMCVWPDDVLKRA